MPSVVNSHEWINGYTARCQHCDWMQSDHIDRPTIKRRAVAHVKKTGHTVRITKTSQITVWPATAPDAGA